MKTIETRVIDTLQPHPRNASLYGNDHGSYDNKLVESLTAGIWPGEIQVTTGNVIISGHRRCEHAIFANIESAEVWVRSDLPEDPAAPQVLEALLQANLQRNKSNEQKLREFALWKEVEKELAKGRMQNAPNQTSHPGEKHRGEKTGDARDLAAKRVGIGSGSDAEKACKALLAADRAEATGDAGQIAKAKEVKKALEKGISAATRKAREVGLVETPKPRAKKGNAPAPTPAQASVPTAGHSEPESKTAPRDSSLPLPQLSQDIIKREKKLLTKRAELLLGLKELQAEATALWKFAQKRWKSDGRSVLRNHMGLAEANMIKQGLLKTQCEVLGIPDDQGYEEILKALDAAAKDLSKSARTALYLFGYTETVEQ